jgi:HlyD family secretion protein
MHIKWTQWVMLALLAGVVSCSGKSEKAGNASEASLISAPLSTGAVTRVVNASGKIVPRNQVQVGSEVSGRVLEVKVDFNSKVKVADVLAIINPETFENTVRQLEARLTSAKADIQVQQASLGRAQVNLDQARIVLIRKTGLYKEEAVSKAQLEEATRTVGVSEADVKLAEARLQSAKAQITQIDAQLSNALANLEKTIIRSPIDGVVIDRKIDPGQTVQASFSAPQLFEIAADLSAIQVEAQIVESDVAGLEKGDPAKFSVDAYPDLSVPGVVEQLRLKSNETNNIVTYVAVISARNDSGQLLPGMTANLEIIADIKPRVSRIPAAAERFRPTPDQIERWEADKKQQAEPTGLNAPIYARLQRIGLAEDKISSIRAVMEKATKPILDIINDPEKSFMHTPMKARLGEMATNILKTQLAPDNFSKYKALIAAERNIREANLWIKTKDNQMRQVPVKLGLSDGAFIEVISGLEPGQQVITGIRAQPRKPKK